MSKRFPFAPGVIDAGQAGRPPLSGIERLSLLLMWLASAGMVGALLGHWLGWVNLLEWLA